MVIKVMLMLLLIMLNQDETFAKFSKSPKFLPRYLGSL